MICSCLVTLVMWVGERQAGQILSIFFKIVYAIERAVPSWAADSMSGWTALKLCKAMVLAPGFGA
jgi:hypothetical protein